MSEDPGLPEAMEPFIAVFNGHINKAIGYLTNPADQVGFGQR